MVGETVSAPAPVPRADANERLIAHLELVGRLLRSPKPSAQERLESTLGREFAQRLRTAARAAATT
jgi:hypothetical protein